MKSEKAAGIWSRLIQGGKTHLQKLYITLQFFTENGLTNHAAAGAYGFLLSAVPTLLLVSFFLMAAFRSSPGVIVDLVKGLPFLDGILDETWLIDDFLALSRPGLPALVSVASIFWAGWIFALAMLRGLKVIFTGPQKRNPVTDNLVLAVIELMVFVFALVMILCSQTALRFYGLFGFLPTVSRFLESAPLFRLRIVPVFSLGFIVWCAYLLVPANAPRRLSALQGAVFCVASSEIASAALRLLLNNAQYNFLYGALGSLVMLLVNVYFFFIFFFFGAQLAFVIDSFDALLFSKMLQVKIRAAQKTKEGFWGRTWGRVFSAGGKLQKYLRFFSAGETIFVQGGGDNEIYYLLEGEVEEYVSGAAAGVLEAGAFFGEMSYLLSAGRSADVKAKTPVSALALPPPLFEEILKYDPGLNRTIIENLSRRLKNVR
jgi:membrane protein